MSIVGSTLQVMQKARFCVVFLHSQCTAKEHFALILAAWICLREMRAHPEDLRNHQMVSTDIFSELRAAVNQRIYPARDGHVEILLYRAQNSSHHT